MAQEMNLVLSSDAKPRLKWTPQLHRRFADAVQQLGGAEKATPKSLMRIMGIQGLTLYHLKSHLQKYRLGRSQQSQTLHGRQEEEEEEESGDNETRSHSTSNAEEEKTNDVQVAESLKMQMEVQRKLHHQIEVQRHLQLRIEAQGRYLQTVLKKAEETLSGYRACSIEVEHARAQLSQLASMVVDSACTTSSLSVMTESDGSMLVRDAATEEKVLGGCSVESSLTSSESSQHGYKRQMEMKNPISENRKRSRVGMDDIDLNRDSLNEFDSGPRGIDLNSDGFGCSF